MGYIDEETSILGLLENLAPFMEKIRQSNELGDCQAVANDCCFLFEKNAVACSIVQVYSADSPIPWFEQEDANRLPLREITVRERGGYIYDYVVHFVPVIGGFVIDINAPSLLGKDNMADCVTRYEDFVGGIRSNSQGPVFANAKEWPGIF